MSRPPRLLALDDERGMLMLIERFAAPQGFEVVTDIDARAALSTIGQFSPDVALVDLRMPDVGGLEVLRSIRERQPECQVILMTAHAAVDSAIEAVKLGAMDYLSKPLDFGRLRQLLCSVREDIDRRAALLVSESDTARRLELCGMIGRSAVMQDLFALVRRLAPHARAALVTGETGAGKEGIARAIHQLGPRKHRKFVTINCSAIVDSLFESELFGHMRGAFTGATDQKAGLFESADGGTLFLDEIGELPLPVQAKLLRVLETGEVQRVGATQHKQVDVRIVAATNRDLRKAAEEGHFRADLYYRLNVVELHVPPLRDRREDIPYLVAAFIADFAVRFQKPIEGLTPAAERLLMGADWPGNVRELRNGIERACMLAEGRWLSERDITRCLPTSMRSSATTKATASSAVVGTDLRSRERDHILKVLEQEHGNKRSAAVQLGVSRRTLYRLLDRHGIPPGLKRTG
jgi:DNA-binding NtrC family response regulator